MTIVNRVRGALLLLCLLATAYIGAVHLILPAAVLLLPVPNPAARTAYRCIVDGVALSWFTLAAALLETLGGVEIVATGDRTGVARRDDFDAAERLKQRRRQREPRECHHVYNTPVCGACSRQRNRQ